jgi:RNA polymerase sigma-70 factor, ECF subfamily
MLGSVHDAEDAQQETLLRAWRGLARFQGRSSLRSWLYTVATNVCLSAIERRPKRVLPVDYGPAASDPHADPGTPSTESVWLEPYPDEVPEAALGPEARYERHESVELAFIAALQHLPAQQRAVLILRDVLGFSGAETAATLGTNATSVYSALQRAHKTVEQRLPEQTQQATLRSIGDERLREIVAGYVDAWERHDVDALATLLAEDVALAMPPYPRWYRGRDTVVTFLREWPLADVYPRWRAAPIRANGQPAFVHYLWDDEAQAFLVRNVGVLTLAGDRIGEITVFRDPELLRHFGVAERL